MSLFQQLNSAADPDFPVEARRSQRGSANLLFVKFLAENCMKMIEFGLSAALHPPLEFPASLSSATVVNMEQNKLNRLDSQCAQDDGDG